MSDFILDTDPLIPTGVPADPVQVGILVIEDVLPADPVQVGILVIEDVLPAESVQVGILVIEDVLPAESIPALAEAQQPTPEDLGAACVASDLPTEDAALPGNAIGSIPQ